MPKPAKRVETRKPDAELIAAMAQDSPVASPDQLSRIREFAREMRDLEINNLRMKEQIKENNVRIEKIQWSDLLDAMDTARMRAMTLEVEGNLPAYEVRTAAHYHANIASDWEPERRSAAFEWIEKHEPGMLRNTFTVEFGKNSRAPQRALEKELKKLKLPYSNEFGVPWNTLTSYVKEQIEEHEVTPPLDLLGAKVGRRATIKPVKKEK